MPDATGAAPKGDPDNNNRAESKPDRRQITDARLAVLERGHCVQRLTAAVERFEELDQSRPVTDDVAHGRELLAASVLEAFRQYRKADRALTAELVGLAQLDLDPECLPTVVRCAGIVPYLARGLELR